MYGQWLTKHVDGFWDKCHSKLDVLVGLFVGNHMNFNPKVFGVAFPFFPH
jgi:hypothetical protein